MAKTICHDCVSLKVYSAMLKFCDLEIFKGHSFPNVGLVLYDELSTSYV